MNIEFWFDYASTYSYPAAMRIESVAADKNVSIVWRPFLLGAIFNKQGMNDSPFNVYPAKGEYMWKDMARICRDSNLPFSRPVKFPQNGLLAARVTTRFSEAPWVPKFVRLVYSANFEHNQDISSSSVIERCLGAVGADVSLVMREAVTAEAKLMLREQTEEAIERGIFGAPSFYVGSELFWGNERLERAIKWAVEADI
ncbi:2-hydroxychromene-2-carboxylate isomerase [Agarivorans sp. Toyoura001]|uniref:2-hydroxychromene-2-carboxylate isomerase n=1 Tax=Agarivorans sp. Toyoura001 TaxID=2283141 RepID=UPI0010EA87DB|nr:2-hydroxychromene-2-carboxylate isomerase [Agarivorans sp. Toyoura001]GDY28158.1 2-hydroxychromene-2-carboxylate isomerase [Agarivorans sp. Toyoura001]